MKNMKKEQCLVILKINWGRVKFGETTFDAIKREIYEKCSVQNIINLLDLLNEKYEKRAMFGHFKD